MGIYLRKVMVSCDGDCGTHKHFDKFDILNMQEALGDWKVTMAYDVSAAPNVKTIVHCPECAVKQEAEMKASIGEASWVSPSFDPPKEPEAEADNCDCPCHKNAVDGLGLHCHCGAGGCSHPGGPGAIVDPNEPTINERREEMGLPRRDDGDVTASEYIEHPAECPGDGCDGCESCGRATGTSNESVE